MWEAVRWRGRRLEPIEAVAGVERPVLLYRRPNGTTAARFLSLRNSIKVPKMKFKDLLSGFIRLHILHHAAEHEVYGQWMIDELARHGYKLSPGTLYPMLHAMEQRGYLRSRKQQQGRTSRKLYRATRLGEQGLSLAKTRLREFTGEAIKN
jgi:PadR family transcriptional regulator, regulatory protein PadR